MSRVGLLGVVVLLAGCGGTPPPPMSLMSYVSLRDATRSFLDASERANCKKDPPSDLCVEGRRLREALRPVDASMLEGYEADVSAREQSARMDRAVEIFMRALSLAGKSAL